MPLNFALQDFLKFTGSFSGLGGCEYGFKLLAPQRTINQRAALMTRIYNYALARKINVELHAGVEVGEITKRVETTLAARI